MATIWKTVPAGPFGTVNSPVSVMTPPLADQLTAVLLALLTWAANCTLVPGATVGFPGVIVMEVDPEPGPPFEEEAIARVVMPWAKESSRLVATIWKTVPAGPFGTVNSPVSVMTPPLADQVTAVLLALLTRAANGTLVPGATVGFSGMTLMVAAADPFVVELDALGAVAGEHARVASNGS
ncbi:MAG: hypothetical protein WB762_01220, partial [Candidatus Sulfotelmatobacter sp.]